MLMPFQIERGTRALQSFDRERKFWASHLTGLQSLHGPILFRAAVDLNERLDPELERALYLYDLSAVM